ncbi:MAG: hypothetical protein HC879_03110 [Leptolyngbyaceae cyanobacterium SL_5_9]|nr:hypothetical protein [Leptolyngbyaceae cyanobacterium SL_5_9]NJO73784.1 hypothetical protein [Leptolyngbyaceae cyanobacterium RM1_406_9]
MFNSSSGNIGFLVEQVSCLLDLDGQDAHPTRGQKKLHIWLPDRFSEGGFRLRSIHGFADAAG